MANRTSIGLDHQDKLSVSKPKKKNKYITSYQSIYVVVILVFIFHFPFYSYLLFLPVTHLLSYNDNDRSVRCILWRSRVGTLGWKVCWNYRTVAHIHTACNSTANSTGADKLTEFPARLKSKEKLLMEQIGKVARFSYLINEREVLIKALVTQIWRPVHSK